MFAESRQQGIGNIMTDGIVVDEKEARRRRIAAADFVPCAEAFIDRRNPNSVGKLNYSFIGPGVAQSDSQHVNLREAHGFNVGGVSLPPGRVNNLHLHFTSEVFIVAAGEWEFIWGNRGEHSALLRPFDVFAIPTWIFRGFINRGGDDAFMFAVLGGDNTGGIIWNPKVLEDAARAGLRLTAKQRVVDLDAGESLPAGESWIAPLPAADMAKLPKISPTEMECCIARQNDLQWRKDALAGGGELAQAAGFGMSAARHHRPLVSAPQGFSLEWLRLNSGADTGAWRTDKPQVFIVFAGAADILLNGKDAEISVPLEKHSIYSVPSGAWRCVKNSGSEEAVVLLVSGGDERQYPQWDAAALAEAAARGLVFDADKRLSPQTALAAA